ncbi:MAG: ABC transporter permease, partial [Acetobacteraceae bacterium]
MRRAPGAGRIALRVVSVVVFLFLFLPIAIVFPLSVSSAPYLQFPPPGFSWQWFERYFNDPSWIDAT